MTGRSVTDRITTMVLSLGMAMVSGCGEGGPRGDRDPAVQPAPVPQPESGFHLPVSLNEVMVALVNSAADPIWLAAWRNPRTDGDWQTLEYRAYQLQLAGALLVVPGNGPMDEEWTSNPQWTAWANRLEAAGDHAVKAAAARDLERIARAGDEIVDVCEGCHFAFKPDLPTSGMFGELSPTAPDFEETHEATP